MTANLTPQTLGKYELLRPLAQGGMGWLFVARELSGQGSEVVLKCVQARSTHNSSRRQVKMFLDEARAATLLEHENIVRVFEVGYEQGFYFLAMEWLKGWDLATVTRQLTEVAGLLPLPILVRLAVDSCRGLHAAHTCTTERGEPLNLVHRDISPANLFVTEQGVVKLLDFGVAKTSIQINATQVGVVKGRLAYMSPEQIRGEPVDCRSDIFSLGVLLHELVNGQRLFKRATPEATFQAVTTEFIPPPVRPEAAVSDNLVGMIMRMLQRDRDLRYSTADVIAQELEQGSGGVPPAEHAEVARHMARLLADGPSSPPLLESTSVTASSLSQWAEAIANRLQPQSERVPERLTTSPGMSPAPTATDLSHVSSPTGKNTVRGSRIAVSLLFVALLGAAAGAVGFLWRGTAETLEAHSGVSRDEKKLADPKPLRPTRPSPAKARPQRRLATPRPLAAERTPKPHSTPRSPSVTTGRPTRSGSSQKQVGNPPKTDRRPSSGSRNTVTRSSKAALAPRQTPASSTGRLTLEAQPWAMVYLGNRALGATPLVEHELPAGRTTLRLTNPDTGIERDITIIIPDGGLLRKKVLLQQLPPP